MTWRLWLAGLGVATLVAACGGGDGSRAQVETSALAATSEPSPTSPATTSTTRPPRSTTSEPEANPPEIAGLGDDAVPGFAVAPTTDSQPRPAPSTPPPDERAPTDPPPPAPPPPPPPPPPTVPMRDLPAWTGSTHPIDPDLAARMTGVSWHEGCPVAIADLRLLQLDHVGFDGHRHEGRLVVHADAADAVLSAFRRMYEARFPIQRVTLVDEAGGSDDAAMAANLTTAFNCRRVTGGTGWSEHSYGRAIDINPVQNPYISSRGTVLPPAGAAYVDRSTPAVGLVVEGGAAVAAFDAVGWHWGGRWRTIKDYQHFSASGR